MDQNADFRFQCGYLKPTGAVVIEDKAEILKTIWLHFVFYNPHADMEQLRNGFRSTLEMEDLCIYRPEEVYSTLVPSTAFDITAGQLIELYVAVYSENGSNRRTKEEAVMLHLSDYILECEGKYTLPRLRPPLLHATKQLQVGWA